MLSFFPFLPRFRGLAKLDISDDHYRLKSYEGWQHRLNDSFIQRDKLLSESRVVNDLGCIIEELKLVLFELIAHQPLSMPILFDHFDGLVLELLIVFDDVLHEKMPIFVHLQKCISNHLNAFLQRIQVE